MKITDVLAILENDQLPHRLRCIAHALLIAMFALDRYGNSMSYSIANGIGSEVDRDRGLVARRALDEIRSLERRQVRQQTLIRILDQRRKSRMQRLREIVRKRNNGPTTGGEHVSARAGKDAKEKSR